MNMLGSFIVKCPKFDNEFSIGTGFTEAQRKLYWDSRDERLGQTLSFKYQAHGMKDVPRHPVFKGFRLD